MSIVAWVDRRFLGSGLVVLVALLPLVATAQNDAAAVGISTRVDPCVPVELEQFHRVLALELGTSIEYSADPTAKHRLTTVWLSCAADGIELRLEDGLTRKSMTRVVDLAHIEHASRSRLLALAVAEFVVASWVELRLTDTPEVRPVGPSPSGQAQKVAARIAQARMPTSLNSAQESDWRLGMTFDVLAFLSAASSLVPGVSVQLLQRVARPALFGLELEFAHRDLAAVWQGRSIGDMRLTTGSALLSVGYAAHSADFDLSASLGGRIGFVQVAGRTKTDYHSASFYDVWGGPALVLALAYRAGSRMSLLIELESGALLQPVEVLLTDHAPQATAVVLRIEHGWARAALGFAWSF